MEHQLTLPVKTRKTLGKAVRHLRKQGELPVVLYGHDVESRTLSVPSREFQKIYKIAGQTSLVNIEADGEKAVKVLIHDIQRDPVTNEILHADLYQVNLTEKVQTEVPLKFTGEAPAVKELEGSLITQKDNVTVEALPADLPHEIEVDISSLQTFEDNIKISDIKAKVPASVAILDEDEEVVALVNPPRSEEELAELEAPTVTEEEQVAALEQTLEAEKAVKVEGEEGEEAPVEAVETSEKKE